MDEMSQGTQNAYADRQATQEGRSKTTPQASPRHTAPAACNSVQPSAHQNGRVLGVVLHSAHTKWSTPEREDGAGRMLSHPNQAPGPICRPSAAHLALQVPNNVATMWPREMHGSLGTR
eukprot:311628-Amphidinium_carterae.1